MMDVIVCECGNHESFFEDKERGSIVCKKCGLVVRSKIINPEGTIKREDGPEYPSRVKSYYLGKGSYIDKKNIDSSGKTIPPHSIHTSRRLRKATEYKDPIYARRQAMVRTTLTLLKELQPVFETSRMFRKELIQIVIEASKLKKKWNSNRNLAAAAFCFLYKKYGSPNPIRIVAKMMEVQLKTLFKMYRKLNETLEQSSLRILRSLESNNSETDFITIKSNELGIPKNTQLYLLKIYKEMNKYPIFQGKIKTGIIAGLIYLVLKDKGNKINQGRIAKTLNVTEATLRNRAKDIVNSGILTKS